VGVLAQTHEAPHVPLPDRSARVGKRRAARGCRRAEAPCAPTGPHRISPFRSTLLDDDVDLLIPVSVTSFEND
jgi:hypothetical protein